MLTPCPQNSKIHRCLKTGRRHVLIFQSPSSTYGDIFFVVTDFTWFQFTLLGNILTFVQIHRQFLNWLLQRRVILICYKRKINTVDFFRHQRNRTEVLPGAAYPIKHLKMPIQLPCQHYLDQTKWVAILIQTWKKKHLHIPKLELSNQTHPTKLKPEFKN